MRNSVDEGAKTAAASARREIGAALEQVAGPVRDGRRIAFMNVIAGALAIVATALAMLSTL